jgi:hypothetical protein
MRFSTLIVFFLAFIAPAASAQSPTIDPCSLLTPADIKAATGLEAGKMTINAQMNTAAGTLCDFQLGDAGSGGVGVRQLRSGETLDAMMAEYKKLKIACVEAPGIGVPSFFASPGFGMVQLNSLKGTTHLIVQLLVFTKPEDQMKAAADKLMRAVLARVK